MRKDAEQRKNPDLITFKESVEMVGVYPPTFKKYAERFGVRGKRVGRCTYFRKDEVQRMRVALKDDNVDILIQAIEMRTGKKVKLV